MRKIDVPLPTQFCYISGVPRGTYNMDMFFVMGNNAYGHTVAFIFEPPRRKTNNVVSEQI